MEATRDARAEKHPATRASSARGGAERDKMKHRLAELEASFETAARNSQKAESLAEQRVAQAESEVEALREQLETLEARPCRRRLRRRRRQRPVRSRPLRPRDIGKSAKARRAAVRRPSPSLRLPRTIFFWRPRCGSRPARHGLRSRYPTPRLRPRFGWTSSSTEPTSPRKTSRSISGSAPRLRRCLASAPKPTATCWFRSWARCETG